MSRKLFVTIIVLFCLTVSSSVRAQQSEQNMVKISDWWMVHHNEIESVINQAYYSWVDGDGNTFLSCFTPDVVLYRTYQSIPGLYAVGITGRDMLKENVADKAEETKENFTGRFLVVQHVNVAPETRSWLPDGDAGNAHGIATALVWETSIDKETGETTLHPYKQIYMMKRIDGEWKITSVINEVMATP